MQLLEFLIRIANSSFLFQNGHPSFLKGFQIQVLRLYELHGATTDADGILLIVSFHVCKDF